MKIRNTKSEIRNNIEIRKLVIWLLVVSCWSLVSWGCGGSSSDCATTTTTLAGGTTTTTSAGATTTTAAGGGGAAVLTIKGTTATGVRTLALGRSRALAVLSGGFVTIGLPTKDSDSIIPIAGGTTEVDGSYNISVFLSSIEGAKTADGYVPNLMVIITGEGLELGCVIPSLSFEAGRENFAPVANEGDMVKQKVARAAFGRGVDPRSFDFNSSIDKKFSSSTVKDWGAADIGKMADAVFSGEAAERTIATGLGIDPAILEQLRFKGNDLHRLYIEPILQQAFVDKTPPNRAALDTAMSSVEAAMKDYAVSLGLTEQQFSDLSSIKERQVETRMEEGGFAADDPAFREAKRRMASSKMITFFLGQWDAANLLATVSNASHASFAATHSATYDAFVASRGTIVAQLNTFMGDAGANPGDISIYIQENFFNTYIFPPPQFIPSPGDGGGEPHTLAEGPGGPGGEGSMEAMMNQYKSSRIMVYFMKTFFENMDQRRTLFSSMEANMKPLFQNRFSDSSKNYYMGPLFWDGSLLGHRPTPEEIQSRVEIFNSLVSAAIDNNVGLRDMFVGIGFSTTQAANLLKAFRMLNMPPETMI